MVDDSLGAQHRRHRDRLIDAGWLIPTGVPGLFGRDARYERVLTAVDRLAQDIGAFAEPDEVYFGPLIPRPLFDRIGYLRNFPHLAGVVSTFDGDDAAHRSLVERLDGGEPYDTFLPPGDLALTPACCYPVYPTLTGPLPEAGRAVTCIGHCFRHEPSDDPMRLQSFRIREHIRVGAPDEVQAWRDRWLDLALEVFAAVDLPVRTDVANDPFFGRSGRLMARSQRDLALKIEFLVDVYEGGPTACASVNLHREHFGELFDITHDGEPAHSSCFGFGLDRFVVALAGRHGTDLDAWPAAVRGRLGW